MPDPLILKLERSGARLTDADRAKLRDATTRRRRVGPREDLVREGDRPGDLHLVLEGFACRHKALPDGKRQIMALLVPGDLCDLHATILGAMDHTVATLSPCTVAAIPRTAVEDLAANHPRVNRALWWSTLVDEATLREWLVNMGQRPADRQLAHLLCELRVRLGTVGLVAEGGSYELPLTQEELADVLGLSPVHVNRVLQQLRGDGLIATRGKTLTVRDAARLEAFAGFDPNYLHLMPGPGSGEDAGVSATSPAAGRSSASRPRGRALPDAGA